MSILPCAILGLIRFMDHFVPSIVHCVSLCRIFSFLTFSFFLNCKWNRAINYFCHIRFSLRQLARKVNHRMKVLLCLTLGNLSKSVYFLPD